MKIFSVFPGLIIIAVVATAQSSIAQDQDVRAADEKAWSATCLLEKNREKCLILSKELVNKYPQGTRTPGTTIHEERDYYDTVNGRFQNALKAYYEGPSDENIEAVFTAGENLLKVLPENQFVIGHVALAGAHAVRGKFYTNHDKVKSFSDRAISTFAAADPPAGWERGAWNNLRQIVIARLNQFLAYRLLESKGDRTQALAHLSNVLEIKQVKEFGAQDPYTFWLRASLHLDEYQVLRSQYDILPDETKIGEQGSQLIRRIKLYIVDRLLPDYARVIAMTADAANHAESLDIRKAALNNFSSFWKYAPGSNQSPAEYIKAIETIPPR